MSNPWTKKNPLMSLWLSSAHKVAGSARAQVATAAKREFSAAQAEAAKQVVDFWAGKATRAVLRKK